MDEAYFRERYARDAANRAKQSATTSAPATAAPRFPLWLSTCAAAGCTGTASLATVELGMRRSYGLEAVASGDPKRIGRRAKNKILGRALGRSGFWRTLWR